MDRLHEMEVFLSVAEAGSFAAGGARLRVSPPAVSRAIASLEDRLGARLLNRTTRSLSLTEAGARFLESTRRLLGEIETAEKDAAGETALAQGHLTVTASVAFGRMIMTPILCGFLANHPRVTVSLMMYDRLVNLVEEGIDLAVRIGDLPDSSLMARRVGEVRRLLVASPDYLARTGAPSVPGDLKLHSIIAFTGLMPNREWRFTEDGADKHIALSPRMEVNDPSAAIAAAEAGDGITIALSYMVADSIREGRLVPVLEDFGPDPVAVQLVYPQSRLVAPKIRAFVDYAAPRLRDELRRLV